MAGRRLGLIIASNEFADPAFAALTAPSEDAEALAAVLADPAIGGFEVRTAVNQPAHEVARTIEDFASDRHRDDLLLLYFSGHGIKDESGRLYFVMANTERRLLGATAVSAAFVNEALDASRSRRNVVLLDCCYSGAFAKGLAAKGDRDVHIAERLAATGRVVITASDSVQYAFEGAELTDGGEQARSVFTSVLVDGLRSGRADLDGDGDVTLGELYDYVHDRVAAEGVQQRPGKWEWGVQGRIVLAHNPHAGGSPLAPADREEILRPVPSPRRNPLLPAGRRRRWLLGGAAVALALASIGAVTWVQGIDRPGGDTAGPGACPAPGGNGWQTITLAAEPVAEMAVEGGELRFEVQGASWRELEDRTWQVVLETTMENDTARPESHGLWNYPNLIVANRAFELSCISADPDPVPSHRVGDGRVGYDIRCEPAGYMEMELGDGVTTNRGTIGLTDAVEPGEC